MSLKIVHCGIFNENDDGNFFYGLERKISHGLIQNGHFVYDFSYRDWERNLRFFGIKNSGLKKMNEKLFKICINLNADLLLLGKAEKIDRQTLKNIKNELPNLKIAQWYVDHLNEAPQFFENLNEVDTFFYANALNLKSLSKKYKDIKFSFFPNISDNAFDKCMDIPKTNDIVYIARDYKEDVRYKFAILLDEFCNKNGLKYKIYASLNNPPIFGNEFHKAINQAKIAINFNRDDALNDNENDKKWLGASDRMAQFMGCGVCTFSPKIKGFERFFEDKKDIVYFKSPDDCFKKIKEYLDNDKFKDIARSGRARALQIVNSKRVTKFMLELIFNEKFTQEYEWSDIVYKNGERI